MLLRIRGVKGMVSGGEDRITGNVLAPVVEGYAPRVGACMGSEAVRR